MGSLFEELEAREAAALVRVEDLEAELGEFGTRGLARPSAALPSLADAELTGRTREDLREASDAHRERRL